MAHNVLLGWLYCPSHSQASEGNLPICDSWDIILHSYHGIPTLKSPVLASCIYIQTHTHIYLAHSIRQKRGRHRTQRSVSDWSDFFSQGCELRDTETRAIWEQALEPKRSDFIPAAGLTWFLFLFKRALSQIKSPCGLAPCLWSLRLDSLKCCPLPAVMGVPIILRYRCLPPAPQSLHIVPSALFCLLTPLFESQTQSSYSSMAHLVLCLCDDLFFSHKTASFWGEVTVFFVYIP